MSNKKGISIDLIVELYESGKTPAEIAESFLCSICNITRRLKKCGYLIARNSKKVRYNRNNRTKVDINFFKNISTEVQAYFLGIMFSDGSVSKTLFYLKLNDEDVLIKFKDALLCEYPIRHNDTPYNNYILLVSSIEMCQNLIDLGCTINKTKTIRFPKIPENLIPHFIRGFIDGDGCIRVGSTLGGCMLDIASASHQFILDLKDKVEPYASHVGISKETNFDVWHLRCGGKQVKAILNWIYADSTVYMQRKYFKYLLISSL